MLDPQRLASAALGPMGRAQFQVADVLRRAQGDMIAALWLKPAECPFQIIASGPHWRLRDYGGRAASRSLLIVAAPIKRPYIWDLSPSVSAIRHCLRMNFHVYLLEWSPASRDTNDKGLKECADAISNCLASIAEASRRSKPFLAGHSLGGTLAAVYAALAPDTIRGLVLLSTPLCFQPATGRFRDALVALVPSELSDTDPLPGSLLSYVSALASPDTFIWSRQVDATLSVMDTQAMDTHARVERWALDEAALPGRLAHQIIDWLYRENRLCSGTLTIDGQSLDPSRLSVPTLAIINTADEVAPLASVKPFLDAASTKDRRIIEYSGELGTGLQHLAILIGRQAHAHIWPEIFAWLNSHK